MVGKWLVILPLLVDLNKVNLQPITNDDTDRRVRGLDARECCPCPDEKTGLAARTSGDGFASSDCSCQPRADDAETSSSIFLPALRAIQPLMKEADHKSEPKPLLQPEVGLASSVLETLRQATDEEYQDALARDAARSAVHLIETALDPQDYELTETPKNVVRIFLNPNGDDMDDNLPEPSHVQETRCIHSPLESIHKYGGLRSSNTLLQNKKGVLRISQPRSQVEVFDLPQTTARRLKNKSLLHRNFNDMDSGTGASNIRERIIQPNLDHTFKSNPNLISFLANNNLQKEENNCQENLQKGFIDDATTLKQKAKPKVHFKLRDLIDNIEANSNKEKFKILTSDLKKYFSTTTQIPLFNVKPKEKQTYHNKPVPLKDLIKLKDVELIPRNNFLKKTATGKSLYPNLKLQSESSKLNLDTDNCKENDATISSTIHNNIKINSLPVSSEIIDGELSPSNTIHVFKSKNNEVTSVFDQNLIPVECLSSLEISNINSNQPIEPEDQNNFDYGDIDIGGEPNNEKLSQDNCEQLSNNSEMQQVTNNEKKDQDLHNKGLQKGEVQKSGGPKDMFIEASNNNDYQIQLLEDLDLPIEVDNNSFNTQSELNNNYNVHQTITNDDDKYTGTNKFQIKKIGNERLNNSQKNLISKIEDCNFQGSPLFNQELSPTEQQRSEDNMKLIPVNDRNIFTNTNEEPSRVSFKDLEDMSNSILNLSECDHLEKENFTKNDEHDTFNTPFDSTIEEEIVNSPDINADFDSEATQNIEENVCKLESSNEMSYNSDIKKSELTAEPSEPDSTSIAEPTFKLFDPKTHFRSTVEHPKINKKKNPIPSADLSNILQVNKQSDFLDNLKTKLDNLFTTTEKITTSKYLKSTEDNINESSNMHPITANFDELPCPPQTFFQEILPLKLPILSLNSHKNNLAAPRYDNQPLTSNRQNYLNFPLEIPNPFEDVLDPSITLGTLSDRVRSHTENAVQNMKETLESTLKESQNFRLSKPTGNIDTQDILESISNRRDEMKEKLEAIHFDLNDRFSSFQEGVLDHFNLPGGNSEFQKTSGKGDLRSGYIPIRKELSLPEITKFRNVKDEQYGRQSKISLKSALKPEVSDLSRFRSTNRESSLQNPITTPIPPFIPRPKVLSSNIKSTPRLKGETLSPSKIPKLLDEKTIKSGRFSKITEEPFKLSKYEATRTNSPVKPLKLNTKDLSRDSPANNFRKTLLQRTQNPASNSEFIKSRHNLGMESNSLDSNGDPNNKQESLSSRMMEGRRKLGLRNNGMSPTSEVDTIHAAQHDEFRIVEPMRENVPYKCKLICYKDS